MKFLQRRAKYFKYSLKNEALNGNLSRKLSKAIDVGKKYQNWVLMMFSV